MPIRTEPLEEPSLILTPMVDIVMLIMIFFMVSTEFRRMESQYDIQLPVVSEAKPLTPLPDEITINVTKEGTVYVGNTQMTFDQLETSLKDAQKRYNEQVVVIRGDNAGPYQHVMSIFNICIRSGIKSIQLANRVETGEGG